MLEDFLAACPRLDPAATSRTPSATADGGGFRPLTVGPARPVELTPPTRAAEAVHLEAPQIEVVRDEEGQVRRIVVTCSCCEQITIECEY